MDQTALFLKDDTFSRRGYVFIYTGPVVAAAVKGRYKRVWVNQGSGATSAPFFDLYTDPPELNGKFLQIIPAKGVTDLMKVRHQLWMKKYPNTPEARDFQALPKGKIEH